MADGLRFTDFMLPSLVETAPAGDDWINEIKHDGYRTQLVLQGGKARALTRKGLDWSGKYRPVVEAAAGLPAGSAVVDGEMVVLDAAGKSDIGALRTAIGWFPERITYVAFDLLHLDGQDLRALPLTERRARLEALVPAAGAIQFSPHVAGGGADFFTAVDRMGLEGIVSKRPGSRYKAGRSEAWLKTKCFQESTYEIAAVLRERGKPPIAYMVDADRRYVGGAFIALNQKLRERLWARVKERPRPVKGLKGKPGLQYVEPGLIGRVRHLKGEEELRHATLRDLVE